MAGIDWEKLAFGGYGGYGCSKREETKTTRLTKQEEDRVPKADEELKGGKQMVEATDCVCAKIVPSKDGIYQGAFVDDVVSEEAVSKFEKMSGETLDIGLKFLAFATGLQFPAREAETMAKRGGVVFIKLEPWSWKGKADQSFSLEDLLAGKYDHLLKRFAEGAKKYGKPVFVSFGHEMNGTWYPWSGNPELYVKAYRYVHDKISQDYGACNTTWVWNPNIDFGNLKEYYPGEAYVDWVAADGYNTEDWGASWRSCPQLFDTINTELESFGKPIMVGEFASDANTPQEEKTAKPKWLTDCLSCFVQDKRIKAYIYFNVDKKEGDKAKEWALDTPEAIKAYSEAIKKYASSFVSKIQTVCGEAAVVQETLPAPVEVKPKPVDKPSAAGTLPVKQVETGRFEFNGGTVSKSGETITFKASRAKDPGFGILTGNADVSSYHSLKFEIRGSLTKLGGWARFIAQIYSDRDNDYTPSTSLDPVELTGEYSTVSVDLGDVKKAKKVQFLLVTDKGSCSVEIRNLRFE